MPLTFSLLTNPAIKLTHDDTEYFIFHILVICYWVSSLGTEESISRVTDYKGQNGCLVNSLCRLRCQNITMNGRVTSRCSWLSYNKQTNSWQVGQIEHPSIELCKKKKNIHSRFWNSENITLLLSRNSKTDIFLEKIDITSRSKCDIFVWKVKKSNYIFFLFCRRTIIIICNVVSSNRE